MVEIIKAGSLPGEKVFKTTCFSCKTQFSFKQKEAEYVSEQRDGDYLRIKCPLEGCNRTCTVAVNPSYQPMDR